MSSRAAAFTLAILVFARLAAAAQTAAPPPAGTAVIRGRVVAADTGKPLRRARVAITAPGGGGPPRTVNTNIDGRYEIRDLPAGQYVITTSRSGYLPLRYGQRRPLEPARPLDILDGHTVERVDFALPRTGLIAGRVTDDVGDPMGGVSVFAMRTEYWRGRRQLGPAGLAATTDDAGQFRVIGLSPGTYVLRGTTRETWTVTRGGRKELMGFAPTYFPGTPDTTQAGQITVGIAAQANGNDFALVPARMVKVSGTAFDSHGRPVSSVGLVEETSGPNGGRVGMAGTAIPAADGTFTIDKIAPGEFTLKAVGSEEVAVRPIVVGGTDIANASLVTSAGWSVSGSILTESGALPTFPRGRVRIVVNPTSGFTGMRMQGEPIGRQLLNDDWTFSATAIVGPARFRVTLPDGWMVKSILQNGRDVTDAAIEMKSGEELSGVQVIVTNRVTTVTAEVTDSKGAPLADGTVVVFARDAGQWSEDSRFIRSARSNQQGQYLIKGLPPGEYLAVALDYVEDGIWNDPEYLESIRRHGQRLTLGEGDSRSISLTLVVP
jgi:Carboxypeptidase regulatory-like domain